MKTQVVTEKTPKTQKQTTRKKEEMGNFNLVPGRAELRSDIKRAINE